MRELDSLKNETTGVKPQIMGLRLPSMTAIDNSVL